MKSNRVLYLDGFNILIAQNAIAHIEDGNGNPCGMYLTTLNMIRTFVDKFKPTKVFFILDGPEAGERRRQLFPDYKNKKRITSRKSKVQIMEGDDNMVYGVEGAFQNQLIKLYEFLQLLPVTTCMVPYGEADDLIAYLALKNKDDFENIIISNDKDYLQLVQPGISVYRWKIKKLYNVDSFSEEMKILASNYIFQRILFGDTSDFIKGVKGVGKKTFERLQPGLLEKDYGNNIEGFVDFLKTMDLSHCNTRERNAIQKITTDENIEKMIMSFKLMKLNEECMLEEQVELMKLQIDEQLEKGLQGMAARVKMKRNYFNKLYNGFNEDKWIHPFIFVKPGVEVNT